MNGLLDFLQKVKEDKQTGCWEWQGGKHSNGYGCYYHNCEHILAHRWIIQFIRGQKLNPKILVCHSCDNPGCVNPMHLFLGKHKDNSNDMTMKDRHSRGTRHPTSKLTDKDVLEIRSSSLSYDKIVAKYHISKSLITQIKKKRRWKHV